MLCRPRIAPRLNCTRHVPWQRLDNPRGSLAWPARQQRWSSSALQLLEHRHLVGDGPGGIVSYGDAEAMQEEHRSKFLAWKSLSDDQRSRVSSPRPRLISFESAPTFTLGRRQQDLLPEQQSRLERPLHIHLAQRAEPLVGTFTPVVHKTARGGLTTYHGPGQLVLWPVLDMHSALHPRYGVASYAAHLEATTRRLLLEEFGVETYTNRDEPGVWAASGAAGTPRKIAALGVHHRRHVTALGIAVNVDVPVEGGEGENAWARFVPCGLEGKLVTSVAAEVGGLGRWDVGAFAAKWAKLFEEGLLDEGMRGEGRL